MTGMSTHGPEPLTGEFRSRARWNSLASFIADVASAAWAEAQASYHHLRPSRRLLSEGKEAEIVAWDAVVPWISEQQ